MGDDECNVKKVAELTTWPSEEEFRQHYLQSGIPVVLKGYVQNWPAAKWTLESLKERAGDVSVHVRKNVHKDEYRVGKKYNIDNMPFSKYLDRLIKNPQSKEASKYYLAVQNLKRTFPMLVDDVSQPSYIGKLHMGPYLWIAAPSHYEFCHWDPDDGFLCVLSGHKRVRLYSYKYVNELYPNPKGHKGRTIQSQVDCSKPDLTKFPAFKDVVCEVADVCAGDALFIPAFYWHQVTSTELTISINYFWGDAGTNTYVQKLLTTRKDAFMYWLLNIIEQNRSLPTFPAYLVRMREMISKFLFKQWHEVLNDEQLDIILDEIKNYLGLSEYPTSSDISIGKSASLKIRGLLWRD